MSIIPFLNEAAAIARAIAIIAHIVNLLRRWLRRLRRTRRPAGELAGGAAP